jgi:hypothetical protein
MAETRDGFQYLSRKEASALLAKMGFPLAPQTLANLAANNNAGKGPPFVRFGENICRYRKDDIEAWVRSKMRRIP